ELRNRLKARGDVDPADYCSQIVSSPNESTELKLASANYLLPYLYPKRGAVPSPRFIDDLQIDVTEFRCRKFFTENCSARRTWPSRYSVRPGTLRARQNLDRYSIRQRRTQFQNLPTGNP